MQIHEGEGWRLQLAPQRHPYCALIGGQDWAIELSPQELSELRRGMLMLLSQRNRLLNRLMPDEELDLELDLSLPATDGAASSVGSVFVALSGNVERWTLRFVLTPADGSRAAEGAWTASASPPLAAALEGLGDGLAGAI